MKMLWLIYFKTKTVLKNVQLLEKNKMNDLRECRLQNISLMILENNTQMFYLISKMQMFHLMMIQMIFLIIKKMIFKIKLFFLLKKKRGLKQNKRKKQFTNCLNIKWCEFSARGLMPKLSLVSTKKLSKELQ